MFYQIHSPHRRNVFFNNISKEIKTHRHNQNILKKTFHSTLKWFFLYLKKGSDPFKNLKKTCGILKNSPQFLCIIPFAKYNELHLVVLQLIILCMRYKIILVFAHSPGSVNVNGYGTRISTTFCQNHRLNL